MQLKHHTKLFSLMLTFAATALIFSSCSDSSTGVNNVESQLKVHTAKNIKANISGSRNGTPNYTLFDLKTGKVVTDSTSRRWDIGFSGTNIIINGGVSGPGNGGAVVVDNAFKKVPAAPTDSGFLVDTKKSRVITEWYEYTGGANPAHAILPLPKTTIILRTGDGNHYAKIKILSYYKGSPEVPSKLFKNNRPPSRYYTFKYVLQLNGTRRFK